MQLLSIQVGLPRTYTGLTETGAANNGWTTAFAKRPVSGPVWVGKNNLEGDGQASAQTHGGVEKACCVYPWEHYSYWQERLDLPNATYGAFAENFTIQGLLETDVCIGDTFAFGGVLVEQSYRFLSPGRPVGDCQDGGGSKILSPEWSRQGARDGT
jgi:MOSC domain-containing protein YiiM